MSVHDHDAAEVPPELATMVGVAFFGVSVAYVAYHSIREFLATSSVLRKIRAAPSVRPSDLRFLLSDGGDSSSCGNLVVVRGSVEVKSSADDVIVYEEFPERGVIWQQSETRIFVEPKGGFGRSADILSKYMKGQHSSSTRTVALVHEEKILPLGKDLTAVGICNLKDSILEIKSCQDLPYFLSGMTKDQIVDNLSHDRKVWMWCSIVFGSLAIGLLGYFISRNRFRWKLWRHQGRCQHQNRTWLRPIRSLLTWL